MPSAPWRLSVFAHGGTAGALIELAVILGILALFAAIAWWGGRKALADRDRVLVPPPGEGEGQPPPPLA